MTRLADLQEAFQSAILDGDEHILGELRDGAGAGRRTLLAVYRDAYMTRLLDVMDKHQRCLRALMGQADFDAMARAYIAARPSRSTSVRWFCTGLPAFLATTAPYAARPCLSELAAIEAAFADALDAPDGAVLTDGDVVPHSRDWTDLVLTPHPSVRRLDLATNAVALRSALEQGTSPPPAEDLEETEHLIVWRRGFTPTQRRLPAEEASLWDAACAGTPFGMLREMAEAAHPDAASGRVADYWRAWAGAGLITEVAATR